MENNRDQDVRFVFDDISVDGMKHDDASKQEFYSFVRSLDALKLSMKGGNKTVVLSPDSPITQIFYGK